MNVAEARRVEDARLAEDPLPAASPRPLFATWHIASSGFETTIRIASGEAATACSVTALTMFSFVATRSSRLIPGWRGRPAVITTTSEPAVSS